MPASETLTVAEPTTPLMNSTTAVSHTYPGLVREKVCVVYGESSCLFGSCTGDGSCVCKSGYSHSAWLRLEDCGVPTHLATAMGAANVVAGVVGMAIVFFYYSHIIAARPENNAASRIVRSLLLLNVSGTLAQLAYLIEGYAGSVFLAGIAIQGSALGYESFCVCDTLWRVVASVLPLRVSPVRRVTVKGAIVAIGMGSALPLLITVPMLFSMGDPSSPNFDVQRFNRVFVTGVSTLSVHLVLGMPVLVFIHSRVHTELTFVIKQRAEAHSQTAIEVRTHIIEIRSRLASSMRTLYLFAPFQAVMLVMISIAYHQGFPVTDFLFYAIFGTLNIVTLVMLLIVRGKRRLMGANGRENGIDGQLRSVLERRGGASPDETATALNNRGDRLISLPAARAMLDQLGVMDALELTGADLEALMGSRESPTSSLSGEQNEEVDERMTIATTVRTDVKGEENPSENRTLRNRGGGGRRGVREEHDTAASGVS